MCPSWYVFSVLEQLEPGYRDAYGIGDTGCYWAKELIVLIDPIFDYEFRLLYYVLEGS